MAKIFLVYYNDFPQNLESFTKNDRNISITKEGVRSFGGAMFPRICIRVKSVSPSEDKDRERKISNLLQYLKDSRQILDFSMQG